MDAAETEAREEEDMEYRKMDARIEFPEEVRTFVEQTFPEDDRAVTGQYSKRMLEVAEQYLFVKEKLKEKYPSYDLQILYCEPRSFPGSAKNIFYVGTEENPDEDGFPVYVSERTEKDTVQYFLEDAFIGEIIHSSYEELLLRALQKKVPSCYRVETKMPDVYGDNFNEKLTAQEVLDGAYPMWNRTVIRVCSADADPQQMIREVTDVIQQNQYYGSYQIVITERKDVSSPVIMENRMIQGLKEEFGENDHGLEN